MNRNKELLKNTFIIFIGRFCTQFITFLLLPIYTHYLMTADYGYIDLIQTYVALLTPIIILRFDSAIFRFIIDVRNIEEQKKKIISSSFCLIMLQIVILSIIFGIINYFIKVKYWIAILLNIISVSISSYLLQLTRGLGKNIDYSISSVISASITIILNMILIIYFKSNASSILYVSFIANTVCCTYLILKNKIYRYINIRKFNKSILMELLNYSIPMIPDGLSWWIVNVSDRTIISALINTAANGIYAISSKFSNILSSAYQIFNMSWQESATLHINDEDKDIFFTDVLNKTYSIFYFICIMILVCIPFIFALFIGKEYIGAYNYIPILLMGNLFNALANITGGVYMAKKETKKVARTTMLAAIINIIINLICVKKIGLYAAAISTLISYIVVAIYRYIDVRKYVNMKLNYKKFTISIITFILSSTMYYVNNIIINCINFTIVAFIVIYCNRQYINTILKKIKIIK